MLTLFDYDFVVKIGKYHFKTYLACREELKKHKKIVWQIGLWQKMKNLGSLKRF